MSYTATRVQALSMYRCARVHNGVGALAGKTIALMFEKIWIQAPFYAHGKPLPPGHSPFYTRPELALSTRNYYVCFIRAFHV